MKVELSIHASNLKNVAGAFKGTSDPYAVVTKLATTPGHQPEVLGKTEVVKNTLSPNWVKLFPIEYDLGTVTKVAISIFDEVRKGQHNPMGSAVFDVGEILGARGNTKAKKLKQGGTLFANVRKSTGSGLLRLKMKGIKLKNVEGMFSKSDPFFELSRKVDTAGGLTWDNVYRSKEIKNTLDPDWEAAVIELSQLCGGNLDLPILVSVFDHESSGKHIAMGQFETSVNGLTKAATSGDKFSLLHKGKPTGTIHIERAEVSGVVVDPVNAVTQGIAATSVSPNVMPIVVPVAATAGAMAASQSADFIDYVSGGCQLNVVVAIDFTGSNGDPRKPGTLHYLHPPGSGIRNDYEMAIAAIISILAKYDSDQKFPVYGFGAKYGGVVRHLFQCGPTVEVQGVAGVLDAYHQVFQSGLVMSSPTVFTEVIDAAAARARNAQESASQRGEQAILLIVTDGAVSDVNATAACLERASEAPLSVVIVGVGHADFSAMQFLDDSIKPPKRDIAQFVQFEAYRDNSAGLTSATLNEVPNQLVGFFQSKGIRPLPPLQRGQSTMRFDEQEEEIDLSLKIEEDEIVVTGGGADFVNGFNASR